MAKRRIEPLEALEYLEDIAYGRKMDCKPYALKQIIETALKELRDIKASKFLVAIPRISGKTTPYDELLLLQNVIKVLKKIGTLDLFTICSKDLKSGRVSRRYFCNDKKITRRQYYTLKEVFKDE